MLADDIAYSRTLAALYPGMDSIQKKIRAAQKFNLATDFALAADGLTDNFHELEKIAPFCRLPYPLCWFEFAQADRHHWLEAPLHFPGLQGAPHRVGFLCETIGTTASHWNTYLCWALKHPPSRADNFKLNISPLMVIYDTKKAVASEGGLAKCIEFEMAPFDLGLEGDVLESYMSTLGRSDWAGEIRYLFSILGLLNSRNVAETEYVEHAKLNRQRIAKRKHPLSAHTLLKIRLTHKPSLVHHHGSRERSGEIRAHFVRGHFKTRKHGIFWWGPHMRGQLEAGYVSKDYEVT